MRKMAKKKAAALKKLVKISREEAIAQGLDRYFTGEPCKYEHVAEREVERGLCLQCRMDIIDAKDTKKERQKLNCKQCGERFQQKRNYQVFCSSKCRLEYWSAASFTRNCKHCGASFVARKNAIFCSPKCRIADWVPKLKGPDLFA
jgi:hypothetical protein